MFGAKRDAARGAGARTGPARAPPPLPALQLRRRRGGGERREGERTAGSPRSPPAPLQRDGNNNPLRIRPDWFPAPWERRRARRGDPEGQARLLGAAGRASRGHVAEARALRRRLSPAVGRVPLRPRPGTPGRTAPHSPRGPRRAGPARSGSAQAGTPRPGFGARASSLLPPGRASPAGGSVRRNREGGPAPGRRPGPRATSAGPRSRSPGSQRVPLSPGVGGASPPRVPSGPGRTPGLGPLLPAPGGGVSPSRGPWSEPKRARVAAQPSCVRPGRTGLRRRPRPAFLTAPPRPPSPPQKFASRV